MTKRALLLCLLFPLAAGFGQWSGYQSTTGGSELDGGLGMTWIDNQAYYSISFQPDLSFGKIGVGLNLNLLYNTNTGKFYAQDWKNRDTGKTDYTRIFRYLRYGLKGDPVYSRLGAFDAERLGHGFILNFYNNQVEYENRKIGLALDVDFGMAGFESMTTSLGRLEVIGGRAYVRPLHNSNIPILKNLAFGGSVVSDTDPDSKRSTKNDAVTVFGLDAELPLLKSKMLSMMLYADHAKIQDFGSGQTVGFRTDFNALWGFLGVSVDVERRFMGKEFIAPYFGPFYEVLRSTTLAEVVDFYTSIGGNENAIPADVADLIHNSPLGAIPVGQSMLLPMMDAKRNAWYGALDFNFFKLVRGVGSFQKVDNYGNSGELHVGAGLAPEVPMVTAEATYDKRGIGNFKDIRTLDFRSVARVGVGYKVKPYLLMYLDYIWNFVWDPVKEQYKPQERFQPRLAFRYPFSM
jgi:hypothetical protein